MEKPRSSDSYVHETLTTKACIVTVLTGSGAFCMKTYHRIAVNA